MFRLVSATEFVEDLKRPTGWMDKLIREVIRYFKSLIKEIQRRQIKGHDTALCYYTDQRM